MIFFRRAREERALLKQERADFERQKQELENEKKAMYQMQSTLKKMIANNKEKKKMDIGELQFTLRDIETTAQDAYEATIVPEDISEEQVEMLRQSLITSMRTLVDLSETALTIVD